MVAEGVTVGECTYGCPIGRGETEGNVALLDVAVHLSRMTMFARLSVADIVDARPPTDCDQLLQIPWTRRLTARIHRG